MMNTFINHSLTMNLKFAYLWNQSHNLKPELFQQIFGSSKAKILIVLS